MLKSITVKQQLVQRISQNLNNYVVFIWATRGPFHSSFLNIFQASRVSWQCYALGQKKESQHGRQR